MPFITACTGCHAQFKISTKQHGQKVLCPKCRSAFVANPVGEPPPPPTVAPATPEPAPQFRCPYCQSTRPPHFTSKTSTAGWVFFWVLLLFLCFPLCWIGLLIKDHYRVCQGCGMKIG